MNLFIADDVGLGKTVEAGLIVRELLLRQKVRRIVVCCPPSVVQQWHDEMEQRFGLTFQVFDREFVLAKRRERGYSVNPWNTHTRFILSQALLELLDPQRFCRGVPVKSQKLLQDVMVRRLKSDLREVVAQGFPTRQIVQVDIDGLPADAPELTLSRLLAEYAGLRRTRLDSERKSVQNAAALVTVSLQKRLLSSIEAFWRTLDVHRTAPT